MPILLLAVAALAGYLLGSVNSSIIVGRLLYGKDVREMGSGNAGATNTLRSLGKKAAVLVLVGDVLKGILACLIGGWLVGNWPEGVPLGAYVGGFFAVVGHNWPVFFGFRGGKGVLTSAAVLMMMAPLPALCCLGVFILALVLWRTVSLGSILAAATFPVFVLLFREPVQLIVVGTLLAVLIILRHTGNIRRLLAGTEPKITDKKPSKA
jgi:glycerol-3-phosphate acyltransferase PlsY